MGRHVIYKDNMNNSDRSILEEMDRMSADRRAQMEEAAKRRQAERERREEEQRRQEAERLENARMRDNIEILLAIQRQQSEMIAALLHKQGGTSAECPSANQMQLSANLYN